MQTMASGWTISAPFPTSPRARGMSPSMVVIAVMSTGLILMDPAVIIAVSISIPSSLNLLMQSTKTMALFTTIPIRSTMPNMEMTLITLPVMRRAIIPPVNASGTEKIIIRGALMDWN